MRYDLHLHSCLSPCADDDMTPATIVGMAKLEGVDLVAITDHNSALNLPAAQKACEAYGVQLLPGIEVTTAEEIHVLCYFATVPAALAMGEILYAALPRYDYDETIWGKQLVCDENDVVLDTLDVLLTSAVALDIYAVKAQCEALGGIAVPAHVAKESTSLLSILGFLPPDLPFEIIELSDPSQLPSLVQKRLLPPDLAVLCSSDAHCIAQIAQQKQSLPLPNALQPYIHP